MKLLRKRLKKTELETMLDDKKYCQALQFLKDSPEKTKVSDDALVDIYQTIFDAGVNLGDKFIAENAVKGLQSIMDEESWTEFKGTVTEKIKSLDKNAFDSGKLSYDGSVAPWKMKMLLDRADTWLNQGKWDKAKQDYQDAYDMIKGMDISKNLGKAVLNEFMSKVQEKSQSQDGFTESETVRTRIKHAHMQEFYFGVHDDPEDIKGPQKEYKAALLNTENPEKLENIAKSALEAGEHHFAHKAYEMLGIRKQVYMDFMKAGTQMIMGGDVDIAKDIYKKADALLEPFRGEEDYILSDQDREAQEQFSDYVRSKIIPEGGSAADMDFDKATAYNDAVRTFASKNAFIMMRIEESEQMKTMDGLVKLMKQRDLQYIANTVLPSAEKNL